jgi:hypothetical protein
LIYFPHLTEMFQFRWYPALHYYDKSFDSSSYRTPPCGVGCPIRKPSDRGIIAPPRRISLLYASFLGMNTLGIHCQLVALQRTKEVIRLDYTPCSFSNKIVIAVRNNPKDYPLRCNYLFNYFLPIIGIAPTLWKKSFNF